MKQKFFIFAALLFLVVVLIGLNAASYVQKEKTPDSESSPNRSTFNAGATGTRAFYDLLAETGRRPVRWQESTAALLIEDKNKPQVFVVVGRTRREFDDKEIEQLLRWVSLGGKLVIIDREPPTELIKTTANWEISADADLKDLIFGAVDPSDQKQMTEKIVAAKPLQPTVYTNKVNAVQPSVYASSVSFTRFADGIATRIEAKPAASPKDVFSENENYIGNSFPSPPSSSSPAPQPTVSRKWARQKRESDVSEPLPPPPPPPKATVSKQGTGEGSGIGSIKPPPPVPPPPAADPDDEDEEYTESPALAAPVAHLANDKKTLLADFPFGSGEIVFLTDPYIVSNNGINLVDNAQLAINLVESGTGIIAFDEFHQGYGAGANRLFNYFEGTPVAAIFLQLAVFVGLILFTQSQRFARALPENESNRLSKLEYVAAMAELQQRTRAFDLALENIYTDFRRRAARLVGADNLTASYKELARLIAERGEFNSNEIENLMFKCEDIIRGEPTNKREIVNLTVRLREIEEKLGMQRRKRQRKEV